MELYAHAGDPSDETSFGGYETVNLAYLPGHASTRESLSQELHTYWQGDGKFTK